MIDNFDTKMNISIKSFPAIRVIPNKMQGENGRDIELNEKRRGSFWAERVEQKVQFHLSLQKQERTCNTARKGSHRDKQTPVSCTDLIESPRLGIIRN